MLASLKQLVRDLVASPSGSGAYVPVAAGTKDAAGFPERMPVASGAPSPQPPLATDASVATTTAPPPLTAEQIAALIDERVFDKMVLMWRYHDDDDMNTGGDEGEEAEEEENTDGPRYTDDGGESDEAVELRDRTATSLTRAAEAADAELRRLLVLRLASECGNNRGETVSFLYDFDDAYESDNNEEEEEAYDDGAAAADQETVAEEEAEAVATSGSALTLTEKARRTVLAEARASWRPVYEFAPGTCVVQAALLTALARDYFVGTYQTLSLKHPTRRAAYAFWHAREHFAAPASRDAVSVLDASAWRAFPSNFVVLARTDSVLMRRVSEAFAKHALDEVPEAETRRAFGMAIVPPLLVRVLFGAAGLASPEGEWRVLPIAFGLLTDPVAPLAVGARVAAAVSDILCESDTDEEPKSSSHPQ